MEQILLWIYVCMGTQWIKLETIVEKLGFQHLLGASLSYPRIVGFGYQN